MLNIKKLLTKTLERINLLTPVNVSISGDNVTLPSGTVKNLIAREVTTGKYLIKGSATYGENANGYRGLYFSTTSGTQAGDGRFWQVEVGNAGNDSVHIHIHAFLEVTAAQGSRTLYLNARQNSGSNLVVRYPGLEILKIG